MRSEILAWRSSVATTGTSAPDGRADHGEERAVGVVVLGGEAGAVLADIDAVERRRRGEAAPHSLEHRAEEAVLDRPIGLGDGKEDRRRGPGPCFIHGGDEARRLGQHARARRARLADQRLARKYVRSSKSRRVATGANLLHSIEKPSSAMRGLSFVISRSSNSVP